jgi:eukaryotic-like serine/threonine-protein kinase
VSSDPDHDGLIGALLSSRYRVEARIGDGAMGIVYRARHVEIGRAFAIKILHTRFSADERSRRRFAREATLAGTLHHPNVVSVVDVGALDDGRRYLVMEYADGPTLLDLINETAPMASGRVLSIVRQLCAGLQHAHELGLIHRDFKPDNVIVERDRGGHETPRIVDFGIAIVRDDVVSSESQRLTTRGLVLGTPHYMAPEHANGAPIDHRIDLFALGVTCYEMLTGQSPFEGDGVDVARANLLSETPAMNVRVPGLEVDPLLEAFTRKLMMKSRDDRPATAQAARQLIELIDLSEQDRRVAAAALGVSFEATTPASSPAPVGWPPSAAASLVYQTTEPLPAPWPISQRPPAPAAAPPEVTPGAEDTEQIAPMRSAPSRIVLPVAAALAVLVALALALHGPPRATPRPEPPVIAGPAMQQPGNAAPLPAAPAGSAAAPAPGKIGAPEAAAPPGAPEAAAPPGAPEAAAPPGAPEAAGATRVRRAMPLPPATRPARPRAFSENAAPPLPVASQPGTPDVAAHDALAPPPSRPVATQLTASGVAQRYGSVGRQLKALAVDSGTTTTTTADLWTLYLQLRINDAIGDPGKLAAANAVLGQIEDEIARRPAR